MTTLRDLHVAADAAGEACDVLLKQAGPRGVDEAIYRTAYEPVNVMFNAAAELREACFDYQRDPTTAHFDALVTAIPGVTALRDALEIALVELYNCGAVVGMAQSEALIQMATARAGVVWEQGQAALANYTAVADDA